jgi:hypothetical protein
MWDFGDGITASGPSTQHAYAQSGSYVVTLTVAGDYGTAVSTQTVLLDNVIIGLWTLTSRTITDCADSYNNMPLTPCNSPCEILAITPTYITFKEPGYSPLVLPYTLSDNEIHTTPQILYYSSWITPTVEVDGTTLRFVFKKGVQQGCKLVSVYTKTQ